MILKENSIFAGRYRLERYLGKGGFSEVWLAGDAITGLRFAIKAGLRNDSDSRIRSFADEYALMFGLNHENLLLPIFFEIYEQMPFLLLPYCEGGPTTRLIGNLSETAAWKIMHDISSALYYLHTRDLPLIHCDVKPSNILSSDGKYLLADFGICHRADPSPAEAPAGSVGTPAYMAPERFIRHSYPLAPSDIFSLGATMYELLAGSTPFGEKGGIELHHGAVLKPIEAEYSDELKALIVRCLNKDAAHRPSPAEIHSLARLRLYDKEEVKPKDRIRFTNYQIMLSAWATIAILSLIIIGWLALFKA